jgi:hypothetical protein
MQKNRDKLESLEDIFVNDNSLTYDGYTIVARRKNVSVEGISTETSYAVLQKGQRVITTFEGLNHPMGNVTRFGLFPFLGGENKQFIVEQSVPRNWSHWIANTVPDYHLLFESRKWGVDGELKIVDVNQDGVFEFSKVMTALYDFEKLPTSQSPLVDVLFAYDTSAHEYLPASQNFQEFALKGIEDEMRSLDRSDERTYLSTMVHIVLRYIYAGKRDEGWAFYESQFKLGNKDQIKLDILNKLRSEPVYRFIYTQ